MNYFLLNFSPSCNLAQRSSHCWLSRSKNIRSLCFYLELSKNQSVNEITYFGKECIDGSTSLHSNFTRSNILPQGLIYIYIYVCILLTWPLSSTFSLSLNGLNYLRSFSLHWALIKYISHNELSIITILILGFNLIRVNFTLYNNNN